MTETFTEDEFYGLARCFAQFAGSAAVNTGPVAFVLFEATTETATTFLKPTLTPESWAKLEKILASIGRQMKTAAATSAADGQIN